MISVWSVLGITVIVSGCLVLGFGVGYVSAYLRGRS